MNGDMSMGDALLVLVRFAVGAVALYGCIGLTIMMFKMICNGTGVILNTFFSTKLGKIVLLAGVGFAVGMALKGVF